ncbi:MAG: trigger factor [Planctomycetia bacterium]|nr:MAG: trigger factor [Planctomycetia bacterium]
MTTPGVADPLDNPTLRERAEKQAESLLESLKTAAKSEVRDIGVLRKEVRITVPSNVIGAEISKNYEDMLGDVQLPGFRKGRAPRALVERRFAAEVRSSLKTTIIGQSFLAVVDREKLEVLGDPLFRVTSGAGEKLVDLNEALAAIDLPEKGDMQFTCEIEVRPTFELPELKGVPVTAPVIEITPELVEEQLARQCRIHGRYEPIDGPAAEEDDLAVADVTLKVDGVEIKTEDNLQLGIRATRLDGIALPDLGERLAGVRAGDQRTCACTVPDDYERADLRGKSGEFAFKIHEVKRLVPVSMEELTKQVGAASEAELREFAKQDMEREREALLVRAKREQIHEYLLTKAPIDVPAGLSARLTDRAVMRRVIGLQQRGVPWADIERDIDALRVSAADEVVRDLKLEFILAKVAETLGLRVTEEEVNNEIARIARRYGRRFDRVRDELHERGLLLQLAEQIRQDKCVDALLKDAVITEAKAPPPKASKSTKTATKPAAKAAEPPTESAGAEPAPKPRRGKKSAE